ncbi:PREDICTED: ATP synthase subunit e, mitochondrial [Dufourea novaeangliae]|uniref:ATP synthase subunit e, mitochondrial n=1 Tax=Dufourea novaeangliae TaxID=178035 RepID=UPI0007674769|nr:PREDICTED: ATP synthase subunit e, mitochondrial [Dufourea novaeangliae]
MSTVEAAPRPLRVSPLIKFARWSLLLTGILYGAFHQHRFKRIEDARREKELQEKPMRDAKLAEEKKRIFEAEMRMLEELSK